MSKRDQKRDFILARGMEVMKTKGYNGTSVNDIVSAAAVPKGSFYNYFASKEAFALAAVEAAAGESRIAAEAVLRDRSQPALVRLASFFESSIQSACDENFRKGCFLGNMCQEMADSSEKLRAALDQKLRALTGIIAEVVDEALQERGNPRQLDPEQTAEFLFNAWEGAVMRAKAADTRKPLDAFLEMLPVMF